MLPIAVWPLPRLANCAEDDCCPAAGLQIDRQIGRVIGEVIRIVATTVPSGHEDSVAAGSGLRDAVDRLLPCVGFHL